MDGLKYRINRKFLISLLLLSSVVTFVLASIDILQDFRSHVHEIENTLNEIEASFKESLKKAMWEIDLTQMNLIIDGIKSVPKISFVEIERESGEKISHGKESSQAINKNFILTYDYGGRYFYLGKVFIQADLKPVYSAVFNRALIVICFYFLRAMLTSLLILMILNELVLKDIIGLTQYFSNSHEIISLKSFKSLRRKVFFKSDDEIDLLVSEVNYMQEKLKGRIRDKVRNPTRLRGSE